eukprot:14659355-Ditylum_brightwellii.AAC.1
MTVPCLLWRVNFNNNIANEFLMTCIKDRIKTGDESEENFHEHLGSDKGDYKGEKLEEKYSPHNDDTDMGMDDNGNENDYEQVVAAGSAVAAGVPYAILGTANMAYDGIKHEDPNAANAPIFGIDVFMLYSIIS